MPPPSAPKAFEVRRYLLAPGAGFIPIPASVDCNYIGWRNAGNVVIEISTDVNVVESFDDLQPNMQNLITTPSPGSPRCFKGTTVFFARVDAAAAESGDLRVQCVL